MNFRTAKMIEPCRRRDGEIVLTVVKDAMRMHEVSFTDLHQAKASKDDIALFEDLVSAPWPLPGEIVCNFDEELKELKHIEMNITRYLRKYIYLRDKKLYSVIAAWVISTYFREDFRYAPLLIFDGLTVSGKSTAIYALSQICYRGELFNSASGPAIAREIEDYGSTILLDEVLDTLSGDRGVDLYTMLKSSFSREGSWVRADPKGRKNYRYRTYTHIALSIKGDTLPEDLHNRAIRINMTSAPADADLADIYNWQEDDYGREYSPNTIRDDLYRLRAYSLAHPAKSKTPKSKRSVDFSSHRLQAHRDVTVKDESGAWLYARVNGLDRTSPAIRSRDRNIASTLYTVGLACGSEYDIISVIVANALAQQEIMLDTPEALAFTALLELVEEHRGEWKDREILTKALFCTYVSKINTSQIAQRYNDILAEQGNVPRDPVHTKTVTAKLNAMGLSYSRTGGGGGNKSWMMPYDEHFTELFYRHLRTFWPEYLDEYKGILTES